MSWRLATLAVTVVVAIAAPSLARADARSEPPLAAALAAYQAQDYARAIAILTPELATLDEHDHAAALRLIGCAHTVDGDRDAAIAAFRASFALEADAALEAALASPDTRSLFEIAHGEWRAALVTDMEHHAEDLAKLSVAVDAPARARGGQPITIGVALTDPASLAARVELSYRRRGQPTFTLLAQRLRPPLGPIRFAIPAEATEATRPFVLEYHVTVRHSTGLDLRRDGDPDHPKLIDVSAGHRPRWYQSWWVRGAFAIGVVGLAAGGYLLYRSLDVGPQDVVVNP